MRSAVISRYLSPVRSYTGSSPFHSKRRRVGLLTLWVAVIGRLLVSRTSRGAHGHRHVPNRTGFGGYDLCGETDDEENPR